VIGTWLISPHLSVAAATGVTKKGAGALIENPDAASRRRLYRKVKKGRLQQDQGKRTHTPVDSSSADARISWSEAIADQM